MKHSATHLYKRGSACQQRINRIFYPMSYPKRPFMHLDNNSECWGGSPFQNLQNPHALIVAPHRNKALIHHIMFLFQSSMYQLEKYMHFMIVFCEGHNFEQIIVQLFQTKHYILNSAYKRLLAVLSLHPVKMNQIKNCSPQLTHRFL